MFARVNSISSNLKYVDEAFCVDSDTTCIRREFGGDLIGLDWTGLSLKNLNEYVVCADLKKMRAKNEYKLNLVG